MDQGFVFLLIGFAGLVAALWVIGRGFGLEQRAYRRRQARALFGLAALLALLGIVQVVQRERIVRRLTAPAVDGRWAAVRIDGRAVPASEWRIGIADGKVAGGRDGCNDWGFGAPELNGGERTIVSTLVGCPEGDPVRKAYWALAMAPEARLELRKDGALRMAALGHEALLRRCRWTEAPLPPGTIGNGRRLCIPE